MEYYLMRPGAWDGEGVPDPYSARLNATGRRQAKQIAMQCGERGIQLLCVSTMLRAQDAADLISEAYPYIERWDLEELEDLGLDDLLGDPLASPWVHTWSEEQRQRGLQRLWIRVTAALARIQVYAVAQGIERIGIVAHETVLSLLLLNWQGLDWRSIDTLQRTVDHGEICHITVEDGAPALIEWLDSFGQ